MKMKLKSGVNFWVIGLCIWLFLSGCHKSESVQPVIERTVLLYMAADNNLDANGYAWKNLEAIKEGMGHVNGRLVIYYDPVYADPVLMTIENKGGNCVLDTIEQYPEEDSASPEVVRRVTRRTQELYPASSYGLIIWSHGTGWLPANASFPNARAFSVRRGNVPQTKIIGEDEHPGEGQYGDSQMEIAEWKSALPDGYHFILFDACFMSAIEVVYELRHKADYIIASPAEIMADGMPYSKIMPLLWGGEDELKQVCREFVNYYENHQWGGEWQSGTSALTRTSKLEDLAECVREILKGRAEEVALLSSSEVWRYPLIAYNQNVFFDLGEYLKQVATTAQYEVFSSLLADMIYPFSTTKFNGKLFPVDKFSGLSTYIPLRTWQNMNDRYFELSWPQVVYEK